jgi:hypothetical protein
VPEITADSSPETEAAAAKFVVAGDPPAKATSPAVPW